MPPSSLRQGSNTPPIQASTNTTLPLSNHYVPMFPEAERNSAQSGWLARWLLTAAGLVAAGANLLAMLDSMGAG